MYQINAHATPTELSNQYGKVKGAYVTIYVNYADIDGAYELAKYYIGIDGWRIDELEDEYFVLNSPNDVEKTEVQFYNEALKEGYSLIFNCYESENDEERKENK